MKKRPTTTEPFSEEWMAVVVQRLRDDKRIVRQLPLGGRLHIDRPLPFLCVYRHPPDRADSLTEELVKGESSYAVVSGDRRMRKQVKLLVQRIVEPMSARFGAFLIIEVWSAPDSDVLHAADLNDVQPTELRPTFTISSQGRNALRRTIEKFEKVLRSIRLLRQSAQVDFVETTAVHPVGMTSLVSPPKAKQLACHVLGLSVRPIFRDAKTGEGFPEVLRMLRRGLGHAFKQTCYTFARTKTTVKPQHYHSLGRRAMVKAVWEVDRRLSEISDSFDFLLQATPVNAEAAWRDFRRCKFRSAPRFYYRPLAVEPAILKRRLYELPIEQVEDPSLADLFRERQDELDRKITMMSDVGTPRFLFGSLQVYGSVEMNLLRLATELLKTLPSRSRDDGRSGQLNAQGFMRWANAEIQYYRKMNPRFTAQVAIRDDMFSGLLCSGGSLLIGRQVQIPRNRVEALLQHEVGTHLLTYYNGLASPFQQLHSGFAGYDGLQEGLAVLTEFLVGGLSRPRLRLLAARVLAAWHLVKGASFIDTFRLLDKDYDFTQRVAYTITMRTYRGGGLTKDIVYLRGLVQILDYLRDGGEIEPLFVGKIAADHIPLIRELQFRQVLPMPPFQPRYMKDQRALARLARVQRGMTVQQLTEDSK